MKPKRYPYSGKTTKSSLIVLGSEKLSNTLSQTLDASFKIANAQSTFRRWRLKQAEPTKERLKRKLIINNIQCYG